jgi:transcription elongation factor Elf1
MTKYLNETFICPRCRHKCQKYVGKTLISFRCTNCITRYNDRTPTINFSIEFYGEIYHLAILIKDNYLSLHDDKCEIYTTKFNTIYSSNENYLSQIDLDNIYISSEKLINKLLMLKEFS